MEEILALIDGIKTRLSQFDVEDFDDSLLSDLDALRTLIFMKNTEKVSELNAIKLTLEQTIGRINSQL